MQTKGIARWCLSPARWSTTTSPSASAVSSTSSISSPGSPRDQQIRAARRLHGAGRKLRPLSRGVESIGGYDTSITFYGEDTDIARRLNSAGKVLFTFDLKMLSSARRLKHEGMVTIAFRYALNYFWTTFFKRPFTREHIDIRGSQLIDIHESELTPRLGA